MKLASILILLFFCSCIIPRKVPNRIRGQFTVCIDSNFNIDSSILKTNGFYEFTYLDSVNHFYKGLSYKSYKTFDTCKKYMIFFKEGFFLDYVFINSKYSHIWAKNSNELKSNLEKVYNNPDLYQDFFDSDFWGVYKIFNNRLIKIQSTSKDNQRINGWSLVERTFNIINNTTISLGSIRNNLDGNSIAVPYNHWYKYWYKIEFITFEHIPEPECWLKKEKWLWCK